MMASIVRLALTLSVAVKAGVEYRTFETKLDHMNGGANNAKFNIRYIVDDQYWRKAAKMGKPAPIFFYAGNEGAIETFYENSGFMTTTLAEEYGALVVFGEHRYFGKSFPFDKAEAFKKNKNTYLTVENVMMDYVELIKNIKM